MAFYPGTLESSNIDAFGISYADQIAGHRVVNVVSDLFTITDPILSKSKTNENDDALGQSWYVTEEHCRYELINWNKRHELAGWKRLEIFNCLSYPEYQSLVSNEEISETTLYMCKNSRGNLINKLFYGYIPIRLEAYSVPSLTTLSIKDVDGWVETDSEINIRELVCGYTGSFLPETGKLYEVNSDGTRTLIEEGLTISPRITLRNTYLKGDFEQGKSYRWILTATGDDDNEVESQEFVIKAFYDVPVIRSFTLNGGNSLITNGSGNYRINTLEFNIDNIQNIEPDTLEILDGDTSFWINESVATPVSPIVIGLNKAVTVGNAYNFYLQFYGKDKTGSRTLYKSSAVLLNSQIVSTPYFESWSVKFYNSNNEEVSTVKGAQTIIISDLEYNLINSENADLSTMKLVAKSNTDSEFTDIWSAATSNSSSVRMNLETGKTYTFKLVVNGLADDGSTIEISSSNKVFVCDLYDVPTITWSDVANPVYNYSGGSLKVSFAPEDYIITNPENVTSDVPQLYYCDNSATGAYSIYNSVTGISLTIGHTYYFKLYISGRNAAGTSDNEVYSTVVAKTFTYDSTSFTSFNCSNTLSNVEGIATITLNNVTWSFSDENKIDPDSVQLWYSYSGETSGYILVGSIQEGSNISFQTTTDCIGKTIYIALSAKDWAGHSVIYSYDNNFTKSFVCNNYSTATLVLNRIEFTDKLSNSKVSTQSSSSTVYGSGTVVINKITYTATNTRNILTNGELYYKVKNSEVENKIGEFAVLDTEVKTINTNIEVTAGVEYVFYIKTTRRNNIGTSTNLTTNSLSLYSSNAKPSISITKLYNGNTEINGTTVQGGSEIVITKIAYTVSNPENLTENLVFTGNGVSSGISFAYSNTGVYEFSTPITYTTSTVSSVLSYKLTSKGYMGVNDTVGNLSSNSLTINVVAETLPIYYGNIGPDITGASPDDFEVDEDDEPVDPEWYKVYDVSRVTDEMINTAVQQGNSIVAETMPNTSIPLIEMSYIYILVPAATGRSAKIYNGFGGYITFDDYSSDNQPAEWNMNGQRIVKINNIDYKLYAAFSTTTGYGITVKVD